MDKFLWKWTLEKIEFMADGRINLKFDLLSEYDILRQIYGIEKEQFTLEDAKEFCVAAFPDLYNRINKLLK